MAARVKHNSARGKSLGQNFLTDETLLDRLAEASGVTDGDDVLEIGAGLGGLTAALARRAKSVTAVEIDGSLEPGLRAAASRFGNVKVLIIDGMKLDWAKWIGESGGSVKFVSNLPYYITTPLLIRAFRMDPPFAGIAFMAQEEAAQRLLAEPGGEGYGPLSVWARVRFEPRAAIAVPSIMFSPPPDVDSQFVTCAELADPVVKPEDYARFGRIVDAAFASRRKTLYNNLRAAFGMSVDQTKAILNKAGLDERVRAEDA
ncbi:MAG: 16S rRNA (adenine(1518)-N(6)/adenine(1519)-N(6))-dimethyltransferase RsmA, partial [Oscillospiraceae bacterium]|nr:16S rRNA (adenine(1518)-N(6)/adenine(1519)-N(6))-dimethyltransferase RsmA [Oscillospiraceae bacterium]